MKTHSTFTFPSSIATGRRNPCEGGSAKEGRPWILAFYFLLSAFLLFSDTRAPEVDYLYQINSGGITITGYAGPGGAITIPATINGLPVTSIWDYAFYGCTSLTSITIPKRITSIGFGAFYGCTSLTAIEVDPANPSYSSLDGVLFNKTRTELIQFPGGKTGAYTIPNSVTSIGYMAFYGCTSLTSITIPNSVTSIGGCAFYGCTSLTSVTIPNSVTSIGDYAFYGCTSLTSITIPNSVTSIGDRAFYGCTSLTSVTIPNSVASIGDYAFFGCTSLTSITIPNSVTSIGDGAFCGCTSLTAIEVDPANPSYSSLDGVLSNKTRTELIQFPGGKTGGLHHPQRRHQHRLHGVLWLHQPDQHHDPRRGHQHRGRAFDGCTSLTSITIPISVTSIGRCAFYGCTSLTSITIPNGVTSIADGAFFGCSSLTSITIPNSVTSIGGSAFSFCINLTSITIPNGVTSIGDGAFYCCISLPSITIPNNVTGIGGYAFYFCTSLTSITIPNSVTSIKDGAFNYCTSLNAIEVDPGNPSYSSLDGVLFDKTRTELIQFPGGKTGAYTIPNSVTSIGDMAFCGCTSLTAIEADPANPSYSSLDGVLFDKTRTELIQFPGGKTGAYTIPNAVTSIGRWAFYGCTKLTSVTIPNSVTSIKWYAFYGCTRLTSVTIPNSVTSIGDGVFCYCPSLTSVVIPNSVTSIGDGAFCYCPGLTGAYFQGNAPAVGRGVFAPTDNAIVYYLLGTAGWRPTFGGRPTALWTNPLLLARGAGVGTNGFTFMIFWAPDVSLVVEATSDLATPAWSPIAANTPGSGTWQFTDPNWTNYPSRFYRARKVMLPTLNRPNPPTNRKKMEPKKIPPSGPGVAESARAA